MNMLLVKSVLVLCIGLLLGCGGDDTFVDRADGETDSNTDNNTLSVQWVEPVTREDGSSLSSSVIDRYEIRYKKTSDTVYSYVVVPNSGTDSQLVNNLNDGEYEFSIRACYDASVDSCGEFSENTAYVIE